MEQREQSDACISFVESRQRKAKSERFGEEVEALLMKEGWVVGNISILKFQKRFNQFYKNEEKYSLESCF